MCYHMKKKKIIISIIIALSLCICFIAGFILALFHCIKSDFNAYSDRMQYIPEYEKKFIESLSVPNDNKLKSGDYILEVWLPNEKPKKTKLKLAFKDGQFDFPPEKMPTRTGMTNSARIQFPLVSWRIEGRGYDVGTEYVGTVYGDIMWGRVYNHGEGSGEELGFWKLYPEKNKK